MPLDQPKFAASTKFEWWTSEWSQPTFIEPPLMGVLLSTLSPSLHTLCTTFGMLEIVLEQNLLDFL